MGCIGGGGAVLTMNLRLSISCSHLENWSLSCARQIAISHGGVTVASR
jgi:hypothetical protein